MPSQLMRGISMLNMDEFMRNNGRLEDRIFLLSLIDCNRSQIKVCASISRSGVTSEVVKLGCGQLLNGNAISLDVFVLVRTHCREQTECSLDFWSVSAEWHPISFVDCTNTQVRYSVIPPGSAHEDQ